MDNCPICDKKDCFIRRDYIRYRDGKNLGITDFRLFRSILLKDVRNWNLCKMEGGSGNAKKTMYLANQYGFASHSRDLVLPDLVRRLEEIGVEVWEPFARNNSLVDGPGNWAHDIAERNMQDIIDADGFFAVINGSPPDAGVMFELGVATALAKRYSFCLMTLGDPPITMSIRSTSWRSRGSRNTTGSVTFSHPSSLSGRNQKPCGLG